jgi:hypothetical protein
MPTTLKNQSTRKVLPLLPLCYQHSASLLGFWWLKGRWRTRTPTTSLPYHSFQDCLHVHSAASSMPGCLGELESPNSDVTNQCRDRFGFRHSGSGGGRTHNLFFAREAFSHWNYRPMRSLRASPWGLSLFSVKVTRAFCVFSVTKGTPPMSYYTLFKGWLPLSPPIGFFALLIHKRPLY